MTIGSSSRSNAKPVVRAVADNILPRTYLIFISMGSSAIVVGSGYIKWDWIGAIVVSLYGALTFIFGKKINSFSVVYTGVFAAYLLFSGLQSSLLGEFNERQYITYFAQYILAFSTFVTLSSMSMSTKHVLRFMNTWVGIACLACALGILQHFAQDLLIDKYLFIPYYKDNRISYKVVGGILAATAWFSEASWFGAFLVVPTLFLAVMLLNARLTAAKRLIYLAALGLMLAGVFVGYSLTAMFAVAIGFGVLFLISGDVGTKLILSLVLSLGAGFTLYVFSDTALIQLILDRVYQTFINVASFNSGLPSLPGANVTSFYVRQVGFHAGIQAFGENPIFGIGLGQALVPFSSGLLTLFAELGIVGGIIYYYLPAIAIKRVFKIYRHYSGLDATCSSFLIAALVADYADGTVTHNTFHLQRWILVSIAVAWIRTVLRTGRDYAHLPPKSSSPAN